MGTNIVVQDPVVDTIGDVDVVTDDITLRRSQRIRRLAISHVYIVYLYEHKFNIDMSFDSASFNETIDSL